MVAGNARSDSNSYLNCKFIQNSAELLKKRKMSLSSSPIMTILFMIFLTSGQSHNVSAVLNVSFRHGGAGPGHYRRLIAFDQALMAGP
jgi:hypothetical protein